MTGGLGGAARLPQRFLCWLPLVLACACVLAVRVLLGFQFPVPWPDETGFIAPAFDFAQTGSLFDPGMNPDRIVMWMPPGYMVLLAAAFRVFGYSFALCRWVSTLACLLSLFVAARLAWRTLGGWRRVVASWVVAVAFLSPCMLIDSNIARMEMLFAALILLALAAQLASLPYLAGALLVLAGLVHFNVVYFLPVLALDLALRLWRRTLLWPRRAEWAALAAAAAALAAYGVLLLQNWPGFVADMSFQLALKHYFGLNDPAHPLWVVMAGAALAICTQPWRWQSGSVLALYGLAFLLMAHNGHEVWYDFAQPLGFALITIGLLAASPALLLAAPSAALTLAMALRITPTLAPLLPTPAMLHRDFVSRADIARIRAFIATLHPGETVNFGWSGMEPFFLPDLARAGAHWTIIRHSVTQSLPFRAYDWRVRCDSAELPRYLLMFELDYPRVGSDSGCEYGHPGEKLRK